MIHKKGGECSAGYGLKEKKRGVCRYFNGLPKWRRSTLHNKLGTQQPRSVGGLNVKFVASALRLYPFKAIWRHSTTSTGCSCSIGAWSKSEPLSSTVLWNCQPPAYTHARCHSVAAIPAPGLIYADIFLWDIPRILCAFQSRVPFPCCSAHVVDCRHRLRTSEDVISRQPRWLDFERDSSKMTSKITPSEKFSPNLTELHHRIVLSLFQNSY